MSDFDESDQRRLQMCVYINFYTQAAADRKETLALGMLGVAGHGNGRLDYDMTTPEKVKRRNMHRCILDPIQSYLCDCHRPNSHGYVHTFDERFGWEVSAPSLSVHSIAMALCSPSIARSWLWPCLRCKRLRASQASHHRCPSCRAHLSVSSVAGMVC